MRELEEAYKALEVLRKHIDRVADAFCEDQIVDAKDAFVDVLDRFRALSRALENLSIAVDILEGEASCLRQDLARYERAFKQPTLMSDEPAVVPSFPVPVGQTVSLRVVSSLEVVEDPGTFHAILKTQEDDRIVSVSYAIGKDMVWQNRVPMRMFQEVLRDLANRLGLEVQNG